MSDHTIVIIRVMKIFNLYAEYIMRNAGLEEAQDIKKRWQEYTEELYKNDLHDPDNHDGVITHL